jgi:hypothetical protein
MFGDDSLLLSGYSMGFDGRARLGLELSVRYVALLSDLEFFACATRRLEADTTFRLSMKSENVVCGDWL